MRTTHTKNTTTSALPALDPRASDAIKRLGGDPGDYCTPKHQKPKALLGSDIEDESTVLPLDTGNHDIDTESPAWLQSLVSGEVEVEDLADELAQSIREDPRFLQRAWWQRFLDYLITLVPNRLIAMAERLTDVRKRLREQDSKD